MTTLNPLHQLPRLIDLSCVRADSSEVEIREAAILARKHNCICVFALPAHTPYLIELLAGAPNTFAGGVVGFPDGGASAAGKAFEAEEAIRMGCRELDMVINLAWLKAGKRDQVHADLRTVVNIDRTVPVKVILECHYLSKTEIIEACHIAVDAGAAFVKTGTGWAQGGTTVENVRLLKQTVGDHCQVKAAGGVKDLSTLLALRKAGATRFGIGLRTAKNILEMEPAAPRQADEANY